jgi:hypothetical protein
MPEQDSYLRSPEVIKRPSSGMCKLAAAHVDLGIALYDQKELGEARCRWPDPTTVECLIPRH